MDFRKKVDNILKHKGIKLWKLAKISELGSTLEKAYKDNREMRPVKTEKFLQKLGIRSKWWESGIGEIFQEEKPGKVTELEEVNIKPGDLIEEGDYIGMHKRVWNQVEQNMITHRELLKSLSETIRDLTRV